ncbi:MAG: ABC transporter ATP-binding protein [Burkholderiaceae bacterium]
MTTPLLGVENLHVQFRTRRGLVDAVRDASFSVDAGRTLGIVGESGSGKSVSAYAVTHLLDPAGRIVGGTIRYRDQDITRANRRTLRSHHGARISMIFQNPRAALNPIRTVGDQLCDVLQAGTRMPRARARADARDLLGSVLIREPAKRLDAYPHELSGGMCQRVMIALAIASEPALLIADEPTTGLDVTTQKTVMDLLHRIVHERRMSLILITHDLGLAAQYCDTVTVMKHGQVVEQAAPSVLFTTPRHDYTRRLVAASPTPTSRVQDLVADGEAVDEPPRPAAAPMPAGTPPLLEVQNVVKRFDGDVLAVRGVSFRIARGESVGLVGESGSGKSTLSRMICRLIDCSEGDIVFDGQGIGGIPSREFHRSELRRDIQLVFQDPHDSLNPRFTAFDCIAHPLRRLDRLGGEALQARVHECARKSGLGDELLGRFPHQLSGGQKARVGIARAIACRPRLLVLDEPTAALDVSVQAIILQLLEKLRREEGLAFLFVSHDLNVVRMMCERTIVLRNGEVVEAGDSRQLFMHPATDYTRALVDAIPQLPDTAVPTRREGVAG